MPPKRDIRLSLSTEICRQLDAACADRGCTRGEVVEAACRAYLDPEKSEEWFEIIRQQLAILIARTAPQEPPAAHAEAPDLSPPPPPWYGDLTTWDTEQAQAAPSQMPQKRSLVSRLFRQETA